MPSDPKPAVGHNFPAAVGQCPFASAAATDPALILRSPAFDVVDYANRYCQLEQRLNLRFPSILLALEHIPLCLAKDRHTAARSDMALSLAKTAKNVNEAIPDAAGIFRSLDTPGEQDILETCIGPAVNRLLSAMVGLDVGLPTDTSVSMVFNQTIGIRKRQRTEDELSQLIEKIKAQAVSQDRKAIGKKLALTILGRDALVGTIANSLHATFLASPGECLAELEFGKYPQRTGVPYVDRIRVNGANQDERDGQLLRVRLDSFETSEDENARLGFFGSGAHTCLGRPQALRLWSEIAAVLKGIHRRVRVVEFREKHDTVFNLPDRFRIEVV